MSSMERREILVFVMEKTIANLGLHYIPSLHSVLNTV